MLSYLAARYSRREELLSYRSELALRGIPVTSRWLNGSHQVDAQGRPIGDEGVAAVEGLTDAAAFFAQEDLADVAKADLVVCFTEEPRRPSKNRGGRHVEMGYALALRKKVVVIGYRENVFCWLPEVFFFPDFVAFINWLDQEGAPC